jgi:histidinol-phosphate phosphatase family protein
MSSQLRPFVFLDRDGTLTVDHGYTHRVEDYVLLPGVADGLRLIARGGYALAVVTNQSGLGRGRFQLHDLEEFHRHLIDDLSRQGVTIESTLHCPHLPDAGCDCRKPAPGLLHRAERELGADLARSWVIGDRLSDIELATRGGCRGGVLVLTGCGQDENARVSPSVPRARDLVEAARIIESGSGQGAP